MRKIILSFALIAFLTSCSIFKSNKTGCPANGRAVGAEKLASGDPKAEKEARKAPKFKF